MTAHPGYTRARTQRERAIDRVWAHLRLASGRGEALTSPQIAEAVGASRTIVKRLIQAARDRGWIEVTSITWKNEKAIWGTSTSPAYRLSASAPVVAPVIRLDPDGPAAEAAVTDITGADLAALRRERGWSLQKTAEMIGVRSPDTIRRYEAQTLLPPRVAAVVRRLGMTKPPT